MRGTLFFLFMVVFMWGCGDTSRTAKTGENEDVSVAPESLEVASIGSAVTAAQKEAKEEIVPGEVSAEIPVASSSIDGEKIVEENRWSLSVYDPSTGTSHYYSKDGALLGQRQK